MAQAQTAADMRTANLPGLMQRLPQEIFDVIHELVFVHPDNVVAITADYRPPAQLQIDSQSRKDFAASYYANTTFVLTPVLGVDWIHSLAVEDFNKISHLQLHKDKTMKPAPAFHHHQGHFLGDWDPTFDLLRFMEEQSVELMASGGLSFSTCQSLPQHDRWRFSIRQSGPVFHTWIVKENAWETCVVCEKVATA